MPQSVSLAQSVVHPAYESKFLGEFHTLSAPCIKNVDGLSLLNDSLANCGSQPSVEDIISVVCK